MNALWKFKNNAEVLGVFRLSEELLMKVKQYQEAIKL